MQPIVTVSNVSFELPNGRSLFKNLQFSLDSKLTALVGPNGIGKTTLARMIAGDLGPSEGHINRRTRVKFFPQRERASHIPIHEYLANRYTWSLLGEQLLDGIDREMKCDQLSGGQWMRVRLAHDLDEQFLILDEPTNDLDKNGKDFLLQFLLGYKFGVLLISHDRECLHLCKDILELSHLGLSKYGGGWKVYEDMKEKERQRALANLDRAKRERDLAHEEQIEQIEKQMKRNHRGKVMGAKGGMPKILLGGRKQKAEASTGKIQASNIVRSQEKIQIAYEAFRGTKTDPVMYAELEGCAIPSQKLIAEAKSFNVYFGKWVYPKDLNFQWRGNIRLAIKGENGSGKSTLIKTLAGQSYQSRGELRRGDLNILYVDQQCSILDESKSIFDNIREVSDLSERDIRNGLARLLFFGESIFQKVQSLSGGERLRAALATGLLRSEKPNLLILDEPTNNLDLGNIKFLEEILSQFKGALIIVSHDELFLRECQIEEFIML